MATAWSSGNRVNFSYLYGEDTGYRSPVTLPITVAKLSDPKVFYYYSPIFINNGCRVVVAVCSLFSPPNPDDGLEEVLPIMETP